MNRLALEASPYLQQHSANPVDWYPWGKEALARAVELDRPILLSIGYSACHWCHVMEHESFSDAKTAAVMNELFVCIKVDREERPDLDQVYQLAVQLTGRSGGWPLTAFLAPDGRPFFAGTYFPPEERYGMPSFTGVLRAVSTAFAEQRGEIIAQAEKMTAALAKATSGSGEQARGDDAPSRLDIGFLGRAVTELTRRFDDRNGGFGDRPKFPNTMGLALLLRQGLLGDDVRSRARALLALESMRTGGIHDQLGFGFHRYSTDARWLVPHFEKMLYDNALLLELYAQALAAERRPEDGETARGIVTYLRREMTGPDGAFYATQDADSEGHEGKFFVWTPEEIRSALSDGEGEAAAAIAAFGVTMEGNFEEPGGTKTGASVLSLRHEGAGHVDAAALGRARAALFAARETRVKPFRDEKIIASWNGLMIRALAHAGGALGESGWIDLAERAFATVMSRLASTVGEDHGVVQLQRLYKGDVVRGPGFLDDYAYLAAAALELYEVTGKAPYVTHARQLARAILYRFADEKGRLFFTAAGGEALIHRSRDPYDQAVPNAAAVAYEVFLRLGSLLGSSDGEEWSRHAKLPLEALASQAEKMPLAMAHVVGVLDRLIRGATEIVLVGSPSDPSLRALAAEALATYVPNRVLAWLDPADPESRGACPALADGKETTAGAAAFVCRDHACSLPVTTAAALASLLRS